MKTFGALLTTALVLSAGNAAQTVVPAAWPQWGGPDRNFVVPDADFALAWPATGPPRLWSRPLGDGFSSIVTDGASLYTLYRDGEDDVVVSLDATTGRTRWDGRYGAPFHELCTEQLGPAPRAAPLTVHAKAQILHERAWTVPTLIGTTLYVRDRHQIMALNLGRP
jgi:hypothetical protein